jgi:hypothetical protein
MMKNVKRKLSFTPTKGEKSPKSLKMNLSSPSSQSCVDSAYRKDSSGSIQSETSKNENNNNNNGRKVSPLSKSITWFKKTFSKTSSDTDTMGRKSKRSSGSNLTPNKTCSSSGSNSSTPEAERTLARPMHSHSTPVPDSVPLEVIPENQRRILQRFRPILPKPEGKENKFSALITRYNDNSHLSDTSASGFKPSAEDHRRPAPGYSPSVTIPASNFYLGLNGMLLREQNNNIIGTYNAETEYKDIDNDFADIINELDRFRKRGRKSL